MVSIKSIGQIKLNMFITPNKQKRNSYEKKNRKKDT